jgi:hypothetical protein
LAEPCLVVSGGAAAQIAATLRCSATAKQFVGLFIVISKGKHGLAFFAPPTARAASTGRLRASTPGNEMVDGGKTGPKERQKNYKLQKKGKGRASQ